MKHPHKYRIVVFGLLIFGFTSSWTTASPGGTSTVLTTAVFQLLGLSSACAADSSPCAKAGEFLVLCYHSVKQQPTPGDVYGISHQQFVEQMEYLRRHDYHVVSLADLIAARSGVRQLPANAVLLTFDDGYRSFREFVLPVLEWYKFPAVLGVVGRWIETPPANLTEPLMSWEELKEVSDHELIEVISHSYDLHKEIRYNPPGNVAAAVSVRLYDGEKGTYETEYEYRRRLENDFKTQKELFMEKLGFAPRALVWPFGRYNAVSLEAARVAGCEITFTLEEGIACLSRLEATNRLLVKNENISAFIAMLKNPNGDEPLIRAVQVDLDSIYDPHSYEQMDKNLGLLIERLVALQVNTVFLQAFADPDGDGNIDSVYFHNRVLPVRADIFSHAAHQIANRGGMHVYAWLPVLSYILPDRELTRSLRVMEVDTNNNRVPSSSWYHRLSPHSAQVREIVSSIYADLAAHCQIDGILFQDDAYLSDFEDFNPAAAGFNDQYLPADVTRSWLREYSDMHRQWARKKTELLIDFTKSLTSAVKKYRPVAEFARNLYSRVLIRPDSELWFAQDYDLFLKNYDQVVVMAYPQMEEAGNVHQWLADLVTLVNNKGGIDRTIFKLQAYDWKAKSWVSSDLLLEEMRDILAAGGRHLGYYPDDLWEARPDLDQVRLEMSSRSMPFCQ